MGSRRWVGVLVALVAIVAVLAGLLQFLAPDVSYQVRDRFSETVSGRSSRTYRIALGARSGSNYRVGEALNRSLKAQSGYELELVETVSPGNVDALMSAADGIDLATITSADDEAVRSEGLYGLAALELQHFFVMVANDNPAQDFRDLVGPINPGVRGPGDPPTLGERVLDYYGMLSPSRAGEPAPVRVVRPAAGNLQDLDSGHNVATTRTQFVQSDLIDRVLQTGRYRLLPIKDHEALAALLPGATAAFIPPGLYGPGKRIPAEPIPTIAVTQLLVSRADVPGRIVRDLLEAVYSPRFQREVQYLVTEEAGQQLAGLPLHPAAEIFYHRNDAITSDRLGRLSFVASAIAGVFAAVQFIGRHRRGERTARRRRLLASELDRLQSLRARIVSSTTAAEVHEAMAAADDLLEQAERENQGDVPDGDGIQAMRSLHGLCGLAAARRVEAFTRSELPGSR